MSKVVIQFKATGNAPILKQPFYKLSSNQPFSTVILFLRKLLQLSEQESIFLYINSSFSPAPDEIVSNLFDCFGIEGTLVCNYSTAVAWG